MPRRRTDPEGSERLSDLGPYVLPTHELGAAAHANLIRFWTLSPGWGSRGELHEDGECAMFTTGSTGFALGNGAFRLSEDMPPGELLDRADEYFHSQGLQYSLMVRGTAEDEDLRAECRERRLVPVGSGAPEMAIHRDAEGAELISGSSVHPYGANLDIELVRAAAGVAEFAALNASAYARVGTPPEEVLAAFDSPEAVLAADGVAILVGRWEGHPVAAAMAVLGPGPVGGLYWVGTLEGVRGKGFGGVISRAATEYTFRNGALACCLQSSMMGETMYRRIGYQPLYRYTTYLRVMRRGGRAGR